LMNHSSSVRLTNAHASIGQQQRPAFPPLGGLHRVTDPHNYMLFRT
jgi:hypothetical protein